MKFNWCYHFGSVTTSKAQQVEDTLNYGRELFKRRHGVDAWGIGFCYDIQVIQLLNRHTGIRCATSSECLIACTSLLPKKCGTEPLILLRPIASTTSGTAVVTLAECTRKSLRPNARRCLMTIKPRIWTNLWFCLTSVGTGYTQSVHIHSKQNIHTHRITLKKKMLERWLSG